MNGQPKRLNAAFRVDASIEIGTGHVMRCLTLADALSAQGITCSFVCREHRGHLIELIRRRTFIVHTLPASKDRPSAEGAGPAHSDWLGCDWRSDALQTQAFLEISNPDWLIVDHYALDARWEKYLRPHCRSLVIVDDLADRPHACDLILDQNIGRLEADYRSLVPDSCKILVGPQFALLRPQFSQWRSKSLRRRKAALPRQILVAMGGVDKDNYTHRVLCALEQCDLPEQAEIVVVMGPHAPWLTAVYQKAIVMPWPTRILSDVQDMAGLMAFSDVAIGAAGSTSWERCALGLPTFPMVIADNQREVARRLSDLGAAILIDTGNNLELDLREAIGRSLAEPVALSQMSRASSKICDGGGCDRVVQELISGPTDLHCAMGTPK